MVFGEDPFFNLFDLGLMGLMWECDKSILYLLI